MKYHWKFAMLRLFIFTVCLFWSVFFSCREGIIEFPAKENTGTIYIASNPAGAYIYLEGIATGKITPDSLTDLIPGNYQVLLKLTGYKDTTIMANIEAGKSSYIVVVMK